MNLGTAIKQVRQKKKIKQQDLAERIGITQTYLSLIESNQKEPNLSKLRKISDCLELPLPILFYLSLEVNDIDSEKRTAFRLLDEPMKSMLKEFFISND